MFTYLISSKSFKRSRRSSDNELFLMRTSKGRNNKRPDQERMKHVHPYFLMSTYSSSLMDLFKKFDMLRLVNFGQNIKKGHN